MSEKATSIPEEQEREAFEAHLKTAAWHQVMVQAKDEDDDGASIFRMCRMAAREAWIAARASLAATERPWNDLSDADRQRAFESMPDMLDGFLKTWGWLHFAKAIEAICREKNCRPTERQDSQALPEQPSDGDYLRWAQREGATHDEHGDPRVVFHSGAQWGRFCDRIRSALAAPTQAPMQPSKELHDCHCGNSYLAVRTDLYKDKREFVYCDCCGALADRKTWRLATTAPMQPSDRPEPVGYVNRDELDNMLDDRTAVIQGKPSGWRKTPLYLAAPTQAAAEAKCATCNGLGYTDPGDPETGASYLDYPCPDCATQPEGWELISVTGFDDLMAALLRADNKGYMPDAMRDEWAAFDYNRLTRFARAIEAKHGIGDQP